METQRIAAQANLETELDSEIKKLSLKLHEQFDNSEYLTHHENGMNAHLTLMMTAINKELHNDAIEKIKKYIDNLKQFEVTIEDIGIDHAIDGDFIFLEITRSSFKKLNTIRLELLELTKEERKGAIPNKYKAVFDTLSEDEKQRLIETGHKYEFIPHVTVGKVPIGEGKNAANYIRDHSTKLIGKSFMVKDIKVSIEQDDWKLPWIHVLEMQLS